MNKIVAKVQAIEETGIVTYIRIKKNNTVFTVIKPETPKWIAVGDQVYCNFQEASVSISKNCPGKVSIENRLSAVLKEVRKNKSLCELSLESDIGDIISLITCRAYDELELEKGCKATLLLRGVDIKLEPVFTQVDKKKYEKYISRIKNAN